MSSKQLYFLCGVIFSSAAGSSRPLMLAVFAAILFVWSAWGEEPSA